MTNYIVHIKIINKIVITEIIVTDHIYKREKPLPSWIKGFALIKRISYHSLNKKLEEVFLSMYKTLSFNLSFFTYYSKRSFKFRSLSSSLSRSERISALNTPSSLRAQSTIKGS